MQFEWDAAKQVIVREKHGIDLNDVVTMFDNHILRLPANSATEVREKAIGCLHGSIITVVFTMRGERFRLITARRARKDEVRAYRDSNL